MEENAGKRKSKIYFSYRPHHAGESKGTGYY